MVRKRKPVRPADPMLIAARRAAERERERDPGQWGADATALSLPANADVEVRADRRGMVTRAQRRDVFDTFHARGALTQGAYDAVRRLQDDMATLHRTHASKIDLSPRVDVSRRPGDGFADMRLRAGERIDAVLGLTGAASARLLTALCEADVVVGRRADWRAVVEQSAGERLPDAQGALVRAACENLAGAYAALERGRRWVG